MSTYRDSLATLLSPDEFARVDAIVARAPRSATFASWLPDRGVLVVGAKLEGELAGWLLVPAADEDEARAIGEELAAGLAELYALTREASRAVAAAIRKAAH